MGRTSHAREKLLAVAFDLIHESSYGTVSVEQICNRATVNKGSFYYFFKTKTDLVVAAYEEHWQRKLPDYERIFSPATAPLRRLTQWCEYVRELQLKRRVQYGRACGCPYTSLGGELATSDPKVRRKAQVLIERQVDYLAKAIADAQCAGAANPGDPNVMAALAHSFVIGLLLRAKIFDDLNILAEVEAALFALIGATPVVLKRNHHTGNSKRAVCVSNR